MKVILIALIIAIICMLIVLVSGITSGVVRIGTIIYRTVFAFAFAGVSSYFFMMLFDLYMELREKKLQKLKAELEQAENTEAESDTHIESATTEKNSPPPEGFQPMNVNNLPRAGGE